MTKLSILGIVVGAALLSVAPVSVQWTPKKVVGLYVDKAEARYGVYRRTYRRAYRRAYRRSYYGGYYGYGYPAYSYGYPYSGLSIGFGFGRRGWW
jgi:hypothetical protein